MFMKIKYVYFFLFFCFIAEVAQSQDVHFTQFDKAPLNINPAYTGSFYGTIRLNGIYRDQYRGIGDPFSTINGSGEFNIPIAFRKNDWIAAGVQLYNDKSGTAKQTMGFYALNLAYHLAFDKSQTRVFTLGAQYGTGSITYNSFSEFISPTDILQKPSTKDGLTIDNNGNAEGGSLNDLMIGALFSTRNKLSNFRMGLSVEGILSPDRGTVVRNSDKKSIGLNVTSEFTRGINEKSAWGISAWYYTQQKANALTAMGKYHFVLKPDSGIRFTAGVGTRSLRSLLFYAGADINDLSIGLSYDNTINSLSTASSYGAIELGITYIYKHYKRPEPKPLIYCPRL